MATVIDALRVLRSEERVFQHLAWAMAATIVAGFGLNLALGRSTFAVPLVYHLHAAVFFGWVVLYLVQNTLVANGNVALHRRLGWLVALWVPTMVVLGVAMTVTSLRRQGGPPFFDMREFLIGNPVGLLAFAGLVGAAIKMRRRTDWHRRLMLCAMTILTGPGLGRLLPMPFLIPVAWWIANLLPLIFPAMAILADHRRGRGFHPAWGYGLGAIVGSLALGVAIAHSPLGFALTERVAAGTPGADRQIEAHFPVAGPP